MNGIRTQKGITLIALIITIVVLVILAGLAINAISDSGIIGHAKNAQTEHEIGEEKEKVNLSVSEAYLAGLGTITEENLDKALESNFGAGNYSLDSSNSEYFKITITKSGREYKVYKNGKVESTLGNSGGENSPEGNEEVKISAIEDLVDFSMIINAGDPDGIYTGKTVTLEKSLDFKDPASYRTANPETTKYIKDGAEVDANGDGTIEPIMTELTQGVGFKPIGGMAYDEDTEVISVNGYGGIFEGNNNTLYNIHINRPEEMMVGLFGIVDADITIQNLGITGNISAEEGYVGGLIGAVYSETGGRKINISNCNALDINLTGDICASLIGSNYGSESLEIANCNIDNSNLSGNMVSGFCGYVISTNELIIESCVVNENTNIIAEGHASGVVLSYAENAMVNIDSCENYGIIKSKKEAVGIAQIAYAKRWCDN